MATEVPEPTELLISRDLGIVDVATTVTTARSLSDLLVILNSEIFLYSKHRFVSFTAPFTFHKHYIVSLKFCPLCCNKIDLRNFLLKFLLG